MCLNVPLVASPLLLRPLPCEKAFNELNDCSFETHYTSVGIHKEYRVVVSVYVSGNVCSDKQKKENGNP